MIPPPAGQERTQLVIQDVRSCKPFGFSAQGVSSKWRNQQVVGMIPQHFLDDCVIIPIHRKRVEYRVGFIDTETLSESGGASHPVPSGNARPFYSGAKGEFRMLGKN